MPGTYTMQRLANAVSIGPSGTLNTDFQIPPSTYPKMRILIRLNGTTTVGDLTSAIRVYDPDGPLEGPVLDASLGLSATETGASKAGATSVKALYGFDATGLNKIQVRVINNNVASKTCDIWAIYN